MPHLVQGYSFNTVIGVVPQVVFIESRKAVAVRRIESTLIIALTVSGADIGRTCPAGCPIVIT